MRHPLNLWKTDGPAAGTMTAKYKPWLADKRVGDPILTRAQMLALILYTGCDANYDMCAAERSRNFDKWPWFSFLLASAMHTMNQVLRPRSERKKAVLYSGKFDKKAIVCYTDGPV